MKQLNDISFVFQNNRAFDALVRKYQSPVRRFFLRLTVGDEELSDDLAQETFIKAYTNLSSFKNLSNFSTWLYRIAYNQFYDYLRSQKETEPLESTQVDVKCQIEQPNAGTQIDVNRALQLLREEERVCIILHYMEDLPIEKVVAITGMPAGTVKSHLSRGKEKLSNYLKQNGYGENR